MQKERVRANSAENTVSRLRERMSARDAKAKEERILQPVTEMPQDKRIGEVEAALCIMYLLQEQGMYISRNKIQLLMYEAYCSWLSNNNEHLFRERPVAQEWGPHFWSIAKAVGDPERGTSPKVNFTNFKAVAERNAGVAAYLKNLVAMYGPRKEEALRAMFVDTAPYKNALPDNNNGKWGGVISDDDIRRWMPNR